MEEYGVKKKQTENLLNLLHPGVVYSGHENQIKSLDRKGTQLTNQVTKLPCLGDDEEA